MHPPVADVWWNDGDGEGITGEGVDGGVVEKVQRRQAIGDGRGHEYLHEKLSDFFQENIYFAVTRRRYYGHAFVISSEASRTFYATQLSQSGYDVPTANIRGMSTKR